MTSAESKRKIAVIGSRTFTDRVRCFTILDFYATKWPEFIMVSGGCPEGGDRFAEEWADCAHHEKLIFPADWKNGGKGAGFARNGQIAAACHNLIAFWDGKSKGTLDTITKAAQLGKPVVIYPVQPTVYPVQPATCREGVK